MIVLLAASLLALAQNRDSVVDQIQSRIRAEPGAQVGLAYIDLASGDTLFINADTSFHAASTMKVPVMIELFRRANSGSFRMDQGLLMVNQFAYNIRVINNSWGSSLADTEIDPNNPINVATRYAHDRNITVVFAAGNAGTAADAGDLYRHPRR
jgi:hypothetical protein